MISRALMVLAGTAALASACGDPSSSRLNSGPDQRSHWEAIAPYCGSYPSKEDCDDGDMALFGGLLCASGDQRGCDLVRDSQGQDGRWWRSPRRNPGNLGKRNSFSRDMALGAMLYLGTIRDADAATRWLDWIEDHRPCVTRNPLGGCLAYGVPRLCDDDQDLRCTITPGNWGMLGRVFMALNLPRNTEMRLHANADATALRFQARHAPPGFELHLAGVEVLLLQTLGTQPDLSADVAATLASRQPDNPFFRYLHRGPVPDDRLRMRALCPVSGQNTGASRSQWAWERDTDEQAWLESMGWDCLFLDNLYTAPSASTAAATVRTIF